MEDINSISSSQISYTLLDGEKSRPAPGRCCRTTTPIVISAVLLTILVPVYILTPRRYSGGTALTTAHDVPEQWVERAIYYSNRIGGPEVEIAKNPSSDYKLVCYYTFPSSSPDDLQPSDIDPLLCTHINVGFATVVNNTIFLNDNQSLIVRDVVALKRRNPDLKILLSVGGAGGTGGFPQMVLNHATRKSFIGSIDECVRNYSIDGVDLDWEFPNKEPSPDSKQKMHFTQLLAEIRAEIKRQQRYKFLLTVAVAAPRFIVDLAYDISYMSSYVDYVNVMTYDYHFYTELTPFTGLNAPLYPDGNETGYLATLNINYTVNYWTDNGMAPDKLVVGLPTYAHTFELYNLNNNGLMAPARGYGSSGHSGFANYPEVCAFLARDRVRREFVYGARSPYAFHEWDWISFDDEISLTFKAEFIKHQKLAGAMILSLNADDHQGRCGEKEVKMVKFPLTNRVKEIFNEN
uniref:GH18 domain-containing protein n=1 Tax=Photinus pyralis TaxID=7054 RepID=A0A1Y1JQQ8_PHOPY